LLASNRLHRLQHACCPPTYSKWFIAQTMLLQEGVCSLCFCTRDDLLSWRSCLRSFPESLVVWFWPGFICKAQLCPSCVSYSMQEGICNLACGCVPAHWWGVLCYLPCYYAAKSDRDVLWTVRGVRLLAREGSGYWQTPRLLLSVLGFEKCLLLWCWLASAAVG
jgi:hypothetical protein